MSFLEAFSWSFFHFFVSFDFHFFCWILFCQIFTLNYPFSDFIYTEFISTLSANPTVFFLLFRFIHENVSQLCKIFSNEIIQFINF